MAMVGLSNKIYPKGNPSDGVADVENACAKTAPIVGRVLVFLPSFDRLPSAKTRCHVSVSGLLAYILKSLVCPLDPSISQWPNSIAIVDSQLAVVIGLIYMRWLFVLCATMKYL